MKYVKCSNCGKRLCKGEAGTKIEIECPKCREVAMIAIRLDGLQISRKIPTKLEVV